MTEDRNPGPVTRREFYNTVGTIYLLVGLTAMGAGQVADKWYHVVLLLILAFGGIVVGLLYNVMALREKGRPSSQ